MWLVITLLAVLVCVINLIINYNGKARMVRRIPGPKDTFILGNALEILVTPVELFHLGRVYANKFKNIYRFWAFGVGSVNIYNPQDVETILSNTKYNDKSVIYKFMKPWLRDGLLLSSGPKWLQRRKVLTPAFHFSMLQNFCGTIEDNSRRLVESLKQQGRDCIDVVPLLSESTLSTICETAMGTKLDDEKSNAGKSYKEAIYELGKLFLERFIKMYLHSDFIFGLSSAGRRQQAHLDTVHSFSSRVVQERRDYLQKHGHVSLESSKENSGEDVYMSSKRKNVAMLDLLLLAEKEGSINDIGIKEEVDTFIFEGHDTSASGLAFCLMLLANNQEAQDKASDELRDIFGNSERPATLEDLAKMRYLECCIKETLRLYPPVHFISRQLNENVTLSNYTVPAGVQCHIHIYDLHRQEDLFKNALTFDPDRFLPENCIGRHPYAYIPFSAGPRNCIGQKFAMLEMKSVVSSILRKFSLLPVTTPDDLSLKSDLVLRNSKPIYVNIVNRY